MLSTDPFQTDPRSLAPLLDDAASEIIWCADELGAVWRHQLAAAIEFDLGGWDATWGERLLALQTASGAPARTFGEILHHPQPDVELLVLVKEFAKAHWAHPGSLIPREISLALYYTAIAAARVRRGKVISSLDEATLIEGLRRVLGVPWLDDLTRSLLAEAMKSSREFPH
jgi:hypothetical protein